jgi:acyl-CoA synthetase (AMP-forming)/AMP-acid ligase II
VDLARHHANRQPTATAFTWLENGEVGQACGLSFGDLDRRARALAARLQQAGLTGANILLLADHGLDFVTAFFGCLYAGAVAVPSYRPRPREDATRLAALLADCQARAVLVGESDPAWRERFGPSDPTAGLPLLSTPHVDLALADLWKETAVTGDTLAMLQYSSGSTGSPRGVMLTHGNILADQQMIAAGFGHSPDETAFAGWLPLFHDMGLIGNVLQPFYLGVHCVLMPPEAFLQRPRRWLEAIAHFHATTAGAPNFGYEHCVRRVPADGIDELDLSRWSVAYNGAEPIHSGTLDRFCEKFAPAGFRRTAFLPCYGMAEASLFVTGGPSRRGWTVLHVEEGPLERHQAVPAEEGGRPLVACGKTWFALDLRIVDPETRLQLPDNTVGEIWLAGPNMSTGYWNQPAVSQQTFAAYLADTEQGPFMRTGDFGFLREGQLYVTGRLKDLIIAQGRNHYPQDIEHSVAQSHPLLRDGRGAAFSVEVEGQERLVVCHEVDRTHRRRVAGDDPPAVEARQELLDAVRAAIVRNHGLPLEALVLVRPSRLPKTSSGKVRRRLCRELFLKGALEEIGALVVWRRLFAEVEGARRLPDNWSKSVSADREPSAAAAADD